MVAKEEERLSGIKLVVLEKSWRVEWCQFLQASSGIKKVCLKGDSNSLRNGAKLWIHQLPAEMCRKRLACQQRWQQCLLEQVMSWRHRLWCWWWWWSVGCYPTGDTHRAGTAQGSVRHWTLDNLLLVSEWLGGGQMGTQKGSQQLG